MNGTDFRFVVGQFIAVIPKMQRNETNYYIFNGRRDTQMGVAEQVSETEVKLYECTRDLIKAHRRAQRLSESLVHAKGQLSIAFQRISSLTEETQRLRELLKKHGVDEANESN